MNRPAGIGARVALVAVPAVFIALFFFIFCFGMSKYSQYLERKLATDHR